MYSRTYYMVKSVYHPEGVDGPSHSRSHESNSFAEAKEWATREANKNEYFVGDAFIDQIRIVEVVETRTYEEREL